MLSNILSVVIVKLSVVLVMCEKAYQQNLSEGSLCVLENGTDGVCKKLPDCPSRVEEVKRGERDSISFGRCGFDDFIEIVCCPMNITGTDKLRPAIIACQDYRRYAKKYLLARPVVYGGFRAYQGEFPFMVALGFASEITVDNPYPIKYSCGGSLISLKHVLTAAHCVNNIHELVPIEAYLGSRELRDNSEGVQRIPISNIITHPRYKRSKAYNDVAILKLQREVKVSDTVKPGCLYTAHPSAINALSLPQILVIGWGATSVSVDNSNFLMRTPSLRIMGNTECNRYYSKFAKIPFGIVDTMICTLDSNKERSADACHGDSGGPLILMTSTFTGIIGISAFGQICGSYTPGVYTAIYPYLEWIEEQVWGSD